MHSPHRWSGESRESLKGLPHFEQTGDTTQGIWSQHLPHQELWGRLSILWQPAQLLGRHKSRTTDPANSKADPIRQRAFRNIGSVWPGLSASIFAGSIVDVLHPPLFCYRLFDNANFISYGFKRPFRITKCHIFIKTSIGYGMKKQRRLPVCNRFTSSPAPLLLLKGKAQGTELKNNKKIFNFIK